MSVTLHARKREVAVALDERKGVWAELGSVARGTSRYDSPHRAVGREASSPPQVVTDLMQQLMSVGTEPTYGAGRHPSLKAAFPDVSVQRTQPRSQLAGRHEGNLQWQ